VHIAPREVQVHVLQPSTSGIVSPIAKFTIRTRHALLPVRVQLAQRAPADYG
jgi:hypothetical protein